MPQETQDTLKEILKKIQGDVHFDDWKYQRIERVLSEVPEEISHISTQFNEKGLHEIIKSENEFLLGVLISFVYYKFLIYSSFDSDPIHKDEIPLFQKSILSNSSKFLDLIFKTLEK